MQYLYECPQCAHQFTVYKRVKDIDREEQCEQCQTLADRKFSPAVYFNGTSIENAEYNPGLGQVVKNKYHRSELCKKHNLQEMGNDFKSGQSAQKYFDSERKEKLEKRWKEDD